MSVEPIYVDLATESEDPAVTEIESLCLACNGKGVTRLLMTCIPHYKEVILTSFECSDCGHRNNGFETGSMQESGVKYDLIVRESQDLSRQIVRSDKAILKIPEIEFEIPSQGQKGEITTVEGIIRKVKDDLHQGQDERRELNSELAEQIENFIGRLNNLIGLSQPFTVTIDDCTGNSFVESLTAPNPDPQLEITRYTRTREQNETLGIYLADENVSTTKDLETVEEAEELEEAEEHEDDLLNLQDDVLTFNVLCNHCSAPCSTKMKVTKIPHFKDAIIMAMNCDFCGFKSNEVKSGGAIGAKGCAHTLRIASADDLKRDILKSDTCSIRIPQLDLDVGSGIFGGKFTTVEGLLCDIKGDLGKNSFLSGDSSTDDTKIRMKKLLDDIQKIIDGELEVELILDDPVGNSYIQDLKTPDVDPQLSTKEYDRSFDQNEDLGLNDMKTENYADSS